MNRKTSHALIVTGIAVLALAPIATVHGETADDIKAFAVPGQECPPQTKTPALSETFVKLLSERQLDLDRREIAVKKDEERLQILRGELEAMFKKQAKNAASKNAAGPSAAASSISHVAQAFETMPPEEAAQRFEKMNDAIALDILARLKSKTTGQILGALSPAKAARLTEKLVGGGSRVSNPAESASARK